MPEETKVTVPETPKTETPTEEVKAEAPKEQTFNQAQLDNIIKSRLEAENKKHQRTLEDAKKAEQEALKEKYGFLPPVEVKLGNIRIARTSATRYSNKNTSEWFAENFSLYAMDRKDLVDPNFIEFFTKEVLK